MVHVCNMHGMYMHVTCMQHALYIWHAYIWYLYLINGSHAQLLGITCFKHLQTSFQIIEGMDIRGLDN